MFLRVAQEKAEKVLKGETVIRGRDEQDFFPEKCQKAAITNSDTFRPQDYIDIGK